MALSESAVSDLLDALRVGEGTDLGSWLAKTVSPRSMLALRLFSNVAGIATSDARSSPAPILAAAQIAPEEEH